MSSGTIRGIILKTEFTWVIRNVLDWPEEEGESLTSPLFHAENDEGIKWSLKIQPDPWLGNGQQQGSLALFLCLGECPASEPTVTTRFSISVSDENEGKILYELKNILLNFTTGSDLYNARLPIGIWHQFLDRSVLIRAIIEYEKIEPNSLHADLENLFTSQTGSDVCFIIDGQEITAHKTILSARSPVFAAMFHSDMKEKEMDRIDIPDISPGIFNELLHFIYTDRFQLTEDNAEPLLVAADKYLLLSLKSKSEEFIIKYLTDENCGEMLMLADLHNALNLKKKSEELFRSRHTEIRKTEAWKTLKSLRPDLAFDVLKRLLDL